MTAQDDSASDGDRRRDERVAGAIPVHLIVKGNQRSAMMRDLSATGVLLLSRARPAVDQAVEVRIFADDAETPSFIRMGRVVRVEKWKDGEAHWPVSIAVEFDEPLEGHEDKIREINERQRALGVL
jgi:hypothetical protein